MGSRRSQLVLLGLGHGHLQMLRDWPQQMRSGVDLTIIAPRPQCVYSGALADVISGQRTRTQATLELQPLIEACGARWIPDRVMGLRAHERTLALQGDPERPLRFDWLSINTGSSMDLGQLELAMPGARGRVLPIRPLPRFLDYWERALETASHRCIAVSVIGGGLGGIELVLAIKRRLAQSGAHASVSLVSGQAPADGIMGSAMRTQTAKALRRAGIQVFPHDCVALSDGELQLSNGMRLCCDLPIVATGSRAPDWLRDSGLQLDAQGYVAVNAHQQSTSHLRVFAVGDVASRIDHLASKTATQALQSGHGHAKRVWSAIQGLQIPPTQSQPERLQFVDTSDGRAIVQWAGRAVAGHWVKAWKRRRDDAILSTWFAPPRAH